MKFKIVLLFGLSFLLAGCASGQSGNDNSENKPNSNTTNTDPSSHSQDGAGGGESEGENKDDTDGIDLKEGELTEEQFMSFLDYQITYELDHLVTSTVETAVKEQMNSRLVTTCYINEYIHSTYEVKSLDPRILDSSKDYWLCVDNSTENIYSYNYLGNQLVEFVRNVNKFEDLLKNGQYGIMPGLYLQDFFSYDFYGFNSIVLEGNNLRIEVEATNYEGEYEMYFDLTLDSNNHISNAYNYSEYAGYTTEANISITYGQREHAPSDIVEIFKDGIADLNCPAFSIDISDEIASINVKTYKKYDEEPLSHEELMGDMGSGSIATTALTVENALKGKNLSGVYQFGGVQQPPFFAYTFYLFNSSNEEVTLSTYMDVMKSNNLEELLKYSRILTQTEVIGTDEVRNVYYGSERKPISSFTTRTEEGGEIEKISTFQSEGNDGYCLAYFNSSLNKPLSYVSLKIRANSVMRVTTAIYYEAYDENLNSPYISGYLNPSIHVVL